MTMRRDQPFIKADRRLLPEEQDRPGRPLYGRPGMYLDARGLTGAGLVARLGLGGGG